MIDSRKSCQLAHDVIGLFIWRSTREVFSNRLWHEGHSPSSDVAITHERGR